MVHLMAPSRHAYLALCAVLVSAVEVPPGLELAIPIAAVVPEVKPYDCDAEADIWEWAWTPDWKAWCCTHESKGCPPTSTATTTTGTTTTDPTTSTITSTGTTTDTTSTTATQTYTQTLTTSTTVTQPPAPTTTQTNTRTMTGTTRTEALHSQLHTDAALSSRPVKSAARSANARSRATAKNARPTTTPAMRTPQPEEASSGSEQASTGEIDDGCNSNCVILGESATCQSRISWVEAHQTQHESAPCPAAHVVVMSQCEACGKCLFKNVKCASIAGVSKSLGEHTFMYRKYLQEPSGAIDVTPVRPRGLVWAVASLGTLPLAVMGFVSHRRRRWVRDDWGVDAAVLVPEE